MCVHITWQLLTATKSCCGSHTVGLDTKFCSVGPVIQHNLTSLSLSVPACRVGTGVPTSRRSRRFVMRKCTWRAPPPHPVPSEERSRISLKGGGISDFQVGPLTSSSMLCGNGAGSSFFSLTTCFVFLCVLF